MNQQEIVKAVLGQGGALALSCVALYYISQLYVGQIDTMMVRCESDRDMYHQHMSLLTEKIDKIAEDVRDIKEAK